MIPYISIVYFFVITLAFGYSLAKITQVKLSSSIYYRFFIYLALGLGTLPLIFVILNLILVPLVWWAILILALIVPSYSFFKRKRLLVKKDFIVKKKDLYLFLSLFLAIVLFVVYLTGAFNYPYMEDDDSWDHAVGSKYVSEYQTYSREVNAENFKRNYLEPYPPAYDVLMGILHQTNDSINWTLKFFNVLIISLGLIFFYIFSELFFNNSKKAIFSTFILFVIPSFMSHFIWSQSLAIVLFFPTLYFIIKSEESRAHLIIAGVLCAGVILSQPSSAAIFAVFYLLYVVAKIFSDYFCGNSIFNSIKVNLVYFLPGIIGMIVSFIFYWLPILIKYGVQLTLDGIGLFSGLFSTSAETIVADTSGGLVYGFTDFMFAPLVSKMDQPIGWGIILFILVSLTILIFLINYKKIKKISYLVAILFWLGFCFLGVQGNAMPIKLFPHRFWAFLAIPVSLLVAEGFFLIYNQLKQRKAIKIFFVLTIFVGLLVTSGYPKYVVETSNWPPGGGWTSSEEIQGYIWMYNNFEKSTPILNVCWDEEKVIGFDMYSPPLNLEIENFYERKIKTMTVKEINLEVITLVNKYNFQYIIIDGTCAKKLNQKADDLLKDILNSSKFTLTHQVPGAFYLLKYTPKK